MFYLEKRFLVLEEARRALYMVKVWKKDGFEIVDRVTTFGNKYQSFKLIN